MLKTLIAVAGASLLVSACATEHETGTTLGGAALGAVAGAVIGNNVLAHVPDINDFTRGLKAALKPGGTITLEFPHLLIERRDV